MTIKNALLSVAIIAAVFAGGSLLAFGEDATARTDCVGSMSQGIPAGVTVTELTAGEVAAVVEKKGAPPVNAPFTFAILSQDDTGMLVIHDGDCVLLPIGPAPLEQINSFLGRVAASNG